LFSRYCCHNYSLVSTTGGTNPNTLSGYGITDAYIKTESNNKFVYKDSLTSNNSFSGDYLLFRYNQSLPGIDPTLYTSFIAVNSETDEFVFVNKGDDPSLSNTFGSAQLRASGFIRQGGTASQFLKADGTIDSSTYCLSSDSRLSDNRTPVAHQLDSATYHTISGKTTGHFLKATSATTFAFVAHGLTPNDVIDTFDALTAGTITSGTFTWASSNENVTLETTSTDKTINVTGATNGESGMAYITTTGSTIILQKDGSATNAKIDSNANLTLTSGNIYMLTWACVGTNLLFNLAEYISQ